MHALSAPPSDIASPLKYLETLRIGLTNVRDRESEEEDSHTPYDGRQMGDLLFRTLTARKDRGYPDLCELTVDSCMMADCLWDYADDVQVKDCDCAGDLDMCQLLTQASVD